MFETHFSGGAGRAFGNLSAAMDLRDRRNVVAPLMVQASAVTVQRVSAAPSEAVPERALTGEER